MLGWRYKVKAQGTWERLTSAEYRDSYALGSLDDTLYLVGGQMRLKNQFLITNCVERWSLQGGPWRSAAPLPLPLAFHSVVSMKDRLYVIGGRSPQVTWCKNTFTCVLIIQKPAFSCVLQYKEFVHCDSSLTAPALLCHPPPPSTIQSYRTDDEPDRLSNRLLEYDPNTNKWTELAPMRYSKYRCSAVELNGDIFVMGKILLCFRITFKCILVQIYSIFFI